MTGYWTLRPEAGIKVPPAMEYESVLSWLDAWPKHTLVVMEGHDGAMSRLAMIEDVIDGLAMAPFINALLREALDAD